MGQRNTQYTGHMTNMETDQHGMDYIHPETCVFYGSIGNYPQPNIHNVLRTPGNASNLILHHPPGHRDNLFFGMTQNNSFQHQHPANSPDPAVATSSSSYNHYMAPASVPRDFLVPVNHGSHEQIPFSSTHSHRVVGIPTDGYGRSYPYMDGVQGYYFKRKSAEGIPEVVPCHDASAASSSSVGRMRVLPVDSDVTSMDTTNFIPTDYRGNETSSIIENESHRSARSRSGIVGSESVLAHNPNHLVQGSYIGQPFQLAGNPWLEMQFSNNTGGNDALSWNQAPPLPYLHGSIAGGRMEAGIMGIHGYQITASSRNSANFVHHPFLPSVHPPLPPGQGVRGHSINFPSQVTSSRNTSINPFQGVAEAGPRYMGPLPPTGFRFYRPHRREDTYDINARHRNLPYLRVLPEDGVAMLEAPGYHEVGDSVDQHRDMRLDIDHMSYEELLALGEQIGSVASGLSEEVIAARLKTRSFVSPVTSSGQGEEASGDRDLDVCVVCQTDYKDQEMVGTLDCGHDYHVECVKKWLVVKNTCPICKSTGLNAERKDL